MSHSDEEEDFHSADEGGFDEEEGHDPAEKPHAPKQQGTDEKDKRCSDEVINKENMVPVSKQKCPTDNNSSDESVNTSKESNSGPVMQKDSHKNKQTKELRDSDRYQDEEGDGDDEEALAERVRERNLKIARKFSAEIARNLRASAPIPVKTSHSTPQNFSEIPDSKDRKSSIQPPAPPSTPALSSSYNNLSDPATQAAGISSFSNTQYGWRVPSKNATKLNSSGASTPSKSINSEDQARHVLDKLTEKLSQTDKNLFERVAKDIKKVSLKNEEVSAESASTTNLPSALMSITDLGSTLGGWGWSGATKLLSSASQVTSQVGSVLDFVVGVSEPHLPSPSSCTKNETGSSINVPDGKTKSSDTKSEQTPINVTYNDPLVDLTLNAMESIGKKAFEVMTTRDETGSLQIKGLGRPWEHLLNTMKTDHSLQDVQEKPIRRRSPPSSPDLSSVEKTCDSGTPRIQSESPPLPSTLSLRKRRHD